MLEICTHKTRSMSVWSGRCDEDLCCAVKLATNFFFFFLLLLFFADIEIWLYYCRNPSSLKSCQNRKKSRTAPPASGRWVRPPAWSTCWWPRCRCRRRPRCRTRSPGTGVKPKKCSRKRGSAAERVPPKKTREKKNWQRYQMLGNIWVKQSCHS